MKRRKVAGSPEGLRAAGGDKTVIVKVALPASTVELLRVLGETPAGVLAQLADHAQQGVYRSGAWERSWLEQAFGSEWQERLEPDPEKPGEWGHFRPARGGGEC